MTRREKLLKAAEFDNAKYRAFAENNLATGNLLFLPPHEWYQIQLKPFHRSLIDRVIELEGVLDKIKKGIEPEYSQIYPFYVNDMTLRQWASEALLPGKLDELIEGEK